MSDANIARNEFAELAGDLAAHVESWMTDIRLEDEIQPWADAVLEINDRYNAIIQHEPQIASDVVTDAGKTMGAVFRVRVAMVELLNALNACMEQADDFDAKYGKE